MTPNLSGKLPELSIKNMALAVSTGANAEDLPGFPEVPKISNLFMKSPSSDVYGRPDVYFKSFLHEVAGETHIPSNFSFTPLI